MSREELLNSIEVEMGKTKSSLVYLCLEETANRLKEELGDTVSERTMYDLVVSKDLKVKLIDKEVKSGNMTFSEYVDEIYDYMEANKDVKINKPEIESKEEKLKETSLFSV